MKKTLVIIPGAILVALLAGGLTALAVSSTVLTKHKPSPVVKTPVVKKVTPVAPVVTSVVTPASTPAPAVATEQPVPVAKTATTNGFVHMREGHSTATPIVQDLQGGYVVTLGDYSDSQWQQATYNAISGYVYKTYLDY